MPVRKIPLGRRSVTGSVSLGRGSGSVSVESTLERDFVLLQIFDPEVIGIEEQPVRISYRLPGGRLTHYTPDFLVRYRSPERGSCLVEVKPAEILVREAEKLRPRFEAAMDYARAKGWAFTIATEKEIRTSRLDNVRFLRAFRDRPVDPGGCARLLRVVEEHQETTPARIMAAAASTDVERAQFLPCLWHLVASFRVGVDLDHPLDMNSVIRAVEVANAGGV